MLNFHFQTRILPVFSNSSKRSSSQLLCFNIVSFHPEHLQLWMIVGLKLKAFQNFIKFLKNNNVQKLQKYILQTYFEHSLVKVNQSFSFEHRLIPVKNFTEWQGPEKSETKKDIKLNQLSSNLASGVQYPVFFIFLVYLWVFTYAFIKTDGRKRCFINIDDMSRLYVLI